jgi:sporulation protein YlmC with PRC-barrel domain
MSRKMKDVVRRADLVALPVVTLAGEDIAEVRDVMFDGDTAQVVGFTLNKRGRRFLGRRLEETLRADQIHAVGSDALMVAADIVLTIDTTSLGCRANVLASRVMTDTGVQVGTVTDVVIDMGTGKVVGYEVCPVAESGGGKRRRSYLPLPVTAAVSGGVLVVPVTAVDDLVGDLAGLARSVDRYRNELRGRT